MAKLLYVTCNLRPVKRSLSLSLGWEFLDHYVRWNPWDEVHILDVYRDNIQRIDTDVLSAWDKLSSGESFTFLLPEEQRKIERIWRLAEQFGAADRYVFVTHMWNLGFPAEFKMYLDAVCVVDKNYRLKANHAQGMLKGQGKRSLHIHAAGAIRYGEEVDSCTPYLMSVMNFLGVNQHEAVVLEGSDVTDHPPSGSSIKSQKRLLELAAHFGAASSTVRDASQLLR